LSPDEERQHCGFQMVKNPGSRCRLPGFRKKISNLFLHAGDRERLFFRNRFVGLKGRRRTDHVCRIDLWILIVNGGIGDHLISTN